MGTDNDNNDFLRNIAEIKAETKILILTTILLSTYLLYYFFKRNGKLPPGPIGLPILGYFPIFGRNPLQTIATLKRKYGRIFGLYLGQRYVVFLNDWDVVKEAFSKTETANRPPGFFDALPNGFGFGAENGAEWSEQRKFTMKAMKDIGLGRVQWEELVQEEVDDLINMLQKENGKAIDVNHYLAPTFASNIMTLVLGYRLPYDHPDAKLVSRTVDSISRFFPVISTENFLPWIVSSLLKIFLDDRSSLMRDLLDFTQYISKAVTANSTRNDSESNESYIDKFEAEMKIEAKDKQNHFFTKKNLHGNTQALLIGGSETSRTTTIWALLAVTKHPEIQRKVREELIYVIGADGKVRWSDRTKIPYTYAVIMEAMRWSTVVPLNTPRITFEDIKISGHDIPSGTVIIAHTLALHNDPKYWPEPEKFVPERFLLNDGKQVNFKPDSFMPFSYGKRSCPGELIALMEVLLYFTTIVRKFEVLPPEDGRLEYETHLGLTCQTHNLRLRFVPIK